MKSLRGHFLVASTQLKDANFYRSVVLMVQHDDAALGLILNRPTGKTVQDAMKLVVDEPTACDDPIFLGGPVRGPIAVVHTDEERGNVEILSGAYYTHDDDLVNELLQGEQGNRRVFLGYSGWAPGQLENELRVGGWQVAPATVADIFAEPEQLCAPSREESVATFSRNDQAPRGPGRPVAELKLVEPAAGSRLPPSRRRRLVGDAGLRDNGDDEPAPSAGR